MVGNKDYLLTYLLTYICLERWGGGLCRVPYFDFSKGGGSTMYILYINWRDGKGRRCCCCIELIQFPCRASFFAPGWFEERDEFILFFISSWCNSYYVFFKLSWCKIASTARSWINFVPLTASTTFAFSSVFILHLWIWNILNDIGSKINF